MKIFKINITVLVLALFFVSCEDELATSPYDQLSAENAFSTVNDIEQGALGAYAAISGQNIYALNALITDNLRRASTNTGQGMQIFNHNIIPGDGTVSGLWSNSYAIIDRVNRVLAAAENIEAATANEEDILNRVRGEMLALRAYQHFELYRNFADYDYPDNAGLAVPYMLESQISQPARDTKQDFFTLLNEDLNEAEAILEGYGYGSGSGNISNERLNAWALKGLRARVAQYTEQWQDAIDYATEVINNVQLTDASTFPSLWDDSVEGEVIFKLPRLTSSDGTISIFERATNSDVFFYASNELTGLYDTDNDVRFASYFEVVEEGFVKVQKYNKISGQKNVADIKMMRVAEMYLIRAEAYAQDGAQQDLGAAAADINTLRANRYASNAPTVTYNSSNEALDDIRLEYRLELAYEGHRYYDLKRAGLPVTRIEDDIDNATASDGFEASSPFFVLPIPQNEIFANDNMIQNPGYSE
ncbi:RagB/SusD family nutrient uptake outer membrane protein [Gracilimonas sp.]|uniref:RagB/SusD family nutrient uptake outer membrane protein n=1 Tax=Gracilimonas sp. TaxID=1974203 RepID=UPI002872357C|nr:RagB/SusD family nutrient uptake outer membrane protein [Gracilimonas sp.]